MEDIPNTSAQKRTKNKKNGCDTSITHLPPPYVHLIEQAKKCPDRKVIDKYATALKASMGVSTLWRDVKNGVFVPPIQMSAGCHATSRSMRGSGRVAWVEAEVNALLAAKALMTRLGHSIDIRIFVTALVSSSVDCV